MNYLKVFKSTYYQILARAFSSGSGFIISIILARSFGVSLYGDYIKITSFVAIFYLLCDFGINAIFIQKEDSQESFRHLLYLRMLIAGAVFLIANVIATFLPYGSSLDSGFSAFVKLGIFIFSFQFFVQSLLFSTNAIFQKKMRFDFWTKAQLFGAVASLVLVGLAAYTGQSLYVVLIALIFSDLITAAVALFYVEAKILPPVLEMKVARELLAGSFPLAMMLIFNLVYFRIDSLILAAFQSSKDVGVYGLSYQLFDFLLAVPLFLSNSIYPILIKEKENEQKFLQLVRSYAYVYLGLSLVILGVFWFASPLFSFIDKDFSSAITPFRILLLGLPFFFLTSLLQWAFITVKKTNFLMAVYFVLMCSNIILNFIFIPKYSYVAAAAITVLGEALVLLLLFVRIVVQRYGRN